MTAIYNQRPAQSFCIQISRQNCRNAPPLKYVVGASNTAFECRSGGLHSAANPAFCRVLNGAITGLAPCLPEPFIHRRGSDLRQCGRLIIMRSFQKPHFLTGHNMRTPVHSPSTTRNRLHNGENAGLSGLNQGRAIARVVCGVSKVSLTQATASPLMRRRRISAGQLFTVWTEGAVLPCSLVIPAGAGMTREGRTRNRTPWVHPRMNRSNTTSFSASCNPGQN